MTVNVWLRGLNQWKSEVPNPLKCTYNESTTAQALLEQIAKMTDHKPNNLTLAYAYFFTAESRSEKPRPWTAECYGMTCDKEVEKTDLVAVILKTNSKPGIIKNFNFPVSSKVSLSVFVKEKI